jgi:two-component system sensor histidine kinase KdpD
MAAEAFDRPPQRDPDALLRQIHAEEQARARGTLKIFLGYASGVGKSFRLFDEGRRRRDRGQDVVVAGRQTAMPPEVQPLAEALELIPAIEADGIPMVDVPAVLARRPGVCLIDGLAYDYPPGHRHARRCDDVEELVAAGISVLTSVNLEYIAEEQAFVRSVTGHAPAAAVPLAFIRRADEVVVVDAPPDSEDGDNARPLSQLRQRALLLTADVVERQLEQYMELHGIQSSWGTQERILVCMTPRANAASLLASGRRNADRFHGELFAIYVTQKDLTAEDQLAIRRNAMLAEAQHARVVRLEARDPITAILDFAREHGITQIFVGHNLRRSWRNRLGGSPLDRLIRDAEGIDVRVFPH